MDKKNIQLHYMDTDSFVLSVNTKDIIEGLRNLKDIFDFSNIDENHELFSNKSKKVNRKFTKETPKKIGLTSLFVREVKCMLLNEKMIVTKN